MEDCAPPEADALEDEADDEAAVPPLRPLAPEEGRKGRRGPRAAGGPDRPVPRGRDEEDDDGRRGDVARASRSGEEESVEDTTEMGEAVRASSLRWRFAVGDEDRGGDEAGAVAEGASPP